MRSECLVGSIVPQTPSKFESTAPNDALKCHTIVSISMIIMSSLWESKAGFVGYATLYKTNCCKLLGFTM